MVIKTTILSTKLEIAQGVTIQVGDVVGVSSGLAILADKNAQIPAIGFAKSVQEGIVYVQTEGKFANSEIGDDFWLGSNGSLVNSVPTFGVVQQIAKRVDNQNILITIDQTVIII